jgi:hypothetical protein
MGLTRAKVLELEENLAKMKQLLDEYKIAIEADGKVTKDEATQFGNMFFKIETIENELKSQSGASSEGMKINMKMLGDSDTPKPEYKGVNFDYKANKVKIDHHNNNLSDGGHYQGSAYQIKGIEFLYKQLTHRVVQRAKYTFEDNQEINDWNDSVDGSMANINTGKSVVVGIVSTFVPIAKGFTLAFAGSVAVADGKFLALSALEGALSASDSLVVETKVDVLRSTGPSWNGIKISLTIKIENKSGKIVEILASDEFTKELNPFGSSKFDDANDQVLRMYEAIENSEIDVPNRAVAPFMIKFKHR